MSNRVSDWSSFLPSTPLPSLVFLFRQGAAVDFLLCLGPETRHTAACFDAQAGEPDAIPNVDPDRIYVMGYSLGGNVALHTAAMDDRVAGAASISGFTPYRTDTNERPTGGIRRLYVDEHLYNIQCREIFTLRYEKLHTEA